ncbi:MAG: NADH:ubiquinone oxidoreductase [Chloroflexi bacterium]|nr:NADH:ubiquinone oxidoreductase [Chloroflexota bacterium]MBI3763573.1 NADH:ubiquinone oxidoreductase [Chloroflexota bacterium]
MSRPKVAFFDFTSCEGCQLTVVDTLQTHPELLDAVEIVQFREAMTEKGEDYQIAFVEGSCARKSDEERLARIRQQAQIVVALGACAHLGGINAIRNRLPLEAVVNCVYNENGDWSETHPYGRPRLSDRLINVEPTAKPIEAIITVDAILPGCPIDREEFARVTRQLLQGSQPRVPDYPLCVECKFKENVCLFQRGQVCLGPVIRAGCGAICPTYGESCEGCRGPISNPNMDSMQSVLAEAGLTADDLLSRFSMFGTYQMMKLE